MSQRVCAGSKSAGYEQRVGTGRRRTAAAVAIPPPHAGMMIPRQPQLRRPGTGPVLDGRQFWNQCQNPMHKRLHNTLLGVRPQ